MIEGSSAAIPFTTILALLGLWLGISLPLTLLGSFFGFRKKVFFILHFKGQIYHM
jgi:transmembrane 9 superfamily protein 2/4